jgi:hypothetical protein
MIHDLQDLIGMACFLFAMLLLCWINVYTPEHRKGGQMSALFLALLCTFGLTAAFQRPYIVVQKPDALPTLDEALEQAFAENPEGATIRIAPGKYTENTRVMVIESKNGGKRIRSIKP